MDVLADLLDGARARGGDFNQMFLQPPWSLRIADGAALALATMLRGDAWITSDGTAPTHVETGDIAVICGSAPYTVADDPGTPPQLLIHSGGRCEALIETAGPSTTSLGTRVHGQRSDTEASIVSGTYQLSTDVSSRLLAALPRVLVVPAAHVPSPIMELVTTEIIRDEPGQQVVLDRWLDLALIMTLRAWFARPESHPPGWYVAQGDPVVGPALRLLHEQPARAWTIADLADAVGMSRAGMARRFSSLVGEPPMSYLAEWRITLAAERLRSSGDTVERIARQVGYANAFALSVAFKRLRGISPADYRRSGAGRLPSPEERSSTVTRPSLSEGPSGA